MTESLHNFPDRVSAERFLSEQGHSAAAIRKGWQSMDPSEAPADLPIVDTDRSKGPTYCKARKISCDDGSKGFVTYCWTVFEDHVEVFWSNTCTGESGGT